MIGLERGPRQMKKGARIGKKGGKDRLKKAMTDPKRFLKEAPGRTEHRLKRKGPKQGKKELRQFGKERQVRPKRRPRPAQIGGQNRCKN